MAVMSFFIVDGSGINATEAISYFGIIAPLLVSYIPTMQ